MADTTLAKNAMGLRFERSWNHVLDRYYARTSRVARPALAFVSQPEPRTIGNHAKGRQLLAGNFLFAGHLVEAPDTMIWDIEPPDHAFEAALHGFAWLDDLVAVGDNEARALAQSWLDEWVRRYGNGKGPGWTPELSGRRIIRWINHAVFLLKTQTKSAADAYFNSLAHQSQFLNKRWVSASVGLPRFEALTGLIYAGLSLEGMSAIVGPALDALGDEASKRIDPNGGIPSRNPEELMEVFTLLTWAASALSEAEMMPRREHVLAIERIAPTLRSLRHSDGALARFHGGGRGVEGRLDNALVTSGVRSTAVSGLAMGYARLSAGRTSVVVDADIPPDTNHSYSAHASTLGMEITSGRRPLIVSCGPGSEFGENWQRAGRATASHSTLGLEGYSSSRFAPRGLINDALRELLVDGPKDVRVQQSQGLDGTSLLATHDGYTATHGLIHVRRLDVSIDGKSINGEDTLGALSEGDRIRFEHLLNRTGGAGILYTIRFHLHPEVEPQLDMGDTAVSLTLKSGEVWVFRHDESATMSIEPSVYLERGRLKPRATKQIVLTSDVVDYASQVTWSLARAQEGSVHVRDLER